MQRAPLAGVGMSYSPINAPSGAMWPILLAKFSVHQILPSGPTVTPRKGRVRRRKFEILELPVAAEPAERICAGFDKPDAAVGMRDHGARLAVMASGILNSLTAPSTVMRPTRLPAASLNHSAPSRTTIDSGCCRAVMPLLNSVIVPLAVMRPIWLTSVSENQTLPSGPSAMPSGPAFAVGT